MGKLEKARGRLCLGGKSGVEFQTQRILSIHDLPNETLHEILSYVTEFQDVFKVRSVCKRWDEALDVVFGHVKRIGENYLGFCDYQFSNWSPVNEIGRMGIVECFINSRVLEMDWNHQFLRPKLMKRLHLHGNIPFEFVVNIIAPMANLDTLELHLSLFSNWGTEDMDELIFPPLKTLILSSYNFKRDHRTMLDMRMAVISIDHFFDVHLTHLESMEWDLPLFLDYEQLMTRSTMMFILRHSQTLKKFKVRYNEVMRTSPSPGLFNMDVMNIEHVLEDINAIQNVHHHEMTILSQNLKTFEFECESKFIPPISVVFWDYVLFHLMSVNKFKIDVSGSWIQIPRQFIYNNRRTLHEVFLRAECSGIDPFDFGLFDTCLALESLKLTGRRKATFEQWTSRLIRPLSRSYQKTEVINISTIPLTLQKLEIKYLCVNTEQIEFGIRFLVNLKSIHLDQIGHSGGQGMSFPFFLDLSEQFYSPVPNSNVTPKLINLYVVESINIETIPELPSLLDTLKSSRSSTKRESWIKRVISYMTTTNVASIRRRKSESSRRPGTSKYYEAVYSIIDEIEICFGRNSDYIK